MRENHVQLAALLVVVLVIITFARYNAMEQTVTRKSIETISMSIDQVTTLLKNNDARYEQSIAKISELEARLAQNEQQKDELSSQVESLSAQMHTLRVNQARAVELRAIDIKKPAGR